MRERKVLVDPKKLVIVTENHGGYTGGMCVVCGSHGWLCEHEYGAPHGNPKKLNALVHKQNCVMNTVLDDNGKLQTPKATR